VTPLRRYAGLLALAWSLAGPVCAQTQDRQPSTFGPVIGAALL